MKSFLKIQLFVLLSLFSSTVFSQAGMWTWISGSNIQGALGVYGTQGVPSVNNHPPGLYEYAEWKDLQGNFWLYGGWDPPYSDLWKYDPITNEWTWVKGNGLTHQPPVYGTLGIPDPANTPGIRWYCSSSWVDLSGNLWLFGGGLTRNDLWKYNISTNEWTWMSGSSFLFAAGIYGTQGVPSPLNTPGARDETCTTWTDSLNNLWLFGGIRSSWGEHNDLWRYSIVTNEWTWMSGSDTNNAPGSYGIKGIPDPANCPSGRSSYSKWKDNVGNFWLMGGSEGWPDEKDDVWKFDPAINQWTWMAGTNTNNDTGVYQTTCGNDSINRPRARIEHRSTVTDYCGRFWLFGGMDHSNKFLNDLWVFYPDQNRWSWISGSNITQLGIYGSIGIPAATNRPGSRWGSVSWWGNDNRFYLFGGSPQGTFNGFSDLWVYTPDTNCISVCNLPPTAFFSAPTEICPGSCIDFTNGSINATSYVWTFTGALITTSTDANPQNVCYNTPGNYDVTLIAGNSHGSDTITLLNYITVYPFPPPQGILQNGDTLFSNQGAVSYQWYFNNDLINGATDYYYVALQSGNYNVVCTDANGCEVEAVLNNVIAAVSPPSLGEESAVRLVPNPTTGELVLQTGKIKIDYIDILTVTGRSILKFEDGSNIIDVSALADGYYFIEIKSNDKLYRSSFVKSSKK